MYVWYTILRDLSSSVGTSSTLEYTVQGSLRPPPEFARTPPPPQNPPILRIDLHIAEPQEPEPPSQLIPTEETSLGIPSATDPTPDSPPSPLPNPQVSPASADGPRSTPPSEHVRQLTSSKIPSSRIGRLFHYGGKPLPCVTLTPQT